MNSDSLLRRAERIIVEVQRRQRSQEQAAIVCIYDLASGERIAGCDAAMARVRLPDNRRGDTWHH